MDKIEKLDIQDDTYDGQLDQIWNRILLMDDKINEIIEKLNEIR